MSERAYQRAVEYALERRQGRAPGAPGGEKSLIVDHPDVRRMLLTMRALTEAMRALAFLQAAEIDRARHEPDEADRTAAHERVELLTPLVKSFCTDRAEQVTSIGIQVHGGMGYIEETGVAQYYRDVKITQIYEGTNGIQAMDLVGPQGADAPGRRHRRPGRPSMRATVAELADGRRPARSDPRRARGRPRRPRHRRTRGSSSRASAIPSRRSRRPRPTSACWRPSWRAGSWPAPRSPRRPRRRPRATTSSRPRW